MWLLVYILHEDRFLTEVLEELIETGVSGATILDSVGMFHYLTQEIPIFAGFRSLLEGTNPQNKMLLSVIKEKKLLKQSIEAIDHAVGGIAKGERGVLFTIKIDHFLGPEISDSSSS